VRRLLITFAFLLAVAIDASGQVLLNNAERDRPLYTSVLAFLNETITANQLEADLREYARAYEAKPYKVGRATIEWTKFPQERLFALLRVIAAITGPAYEAFNKGELTVAQTAVKVAPFFLMWEGYGMDGPPGDSAARLRIDELLAEVHKFSATTINPFFGTVAEAYTSPDVGVAIDAAPRMFLVPDNVCAKAPHARVLESPAPSLELRTGEPFPITELVIIARDQTGALLPRVPIAIDVEVFDPPLLNHLSNAMPENHLHPLRPGAFRVRARTWCSDTPVQLLIPAVIR
jgi:hypothetical protein